MGNVSAFLNLVGTLSNILAMISWLIGKKRSLAIRFVHFLSDDLLEKTEVSSVVTTWTTNKAKSVFIALPMEKLNLTTFCRISRFFPWVSRFSFIRSWQVCTLQATVLSFLLRLLRKVESYRSAPKVYFSDLSRRVNERNQLSTHEGRNSWDSCDHDKVIHVSSIKYLKNNVCHWGSSACYVYYCYCFASVRWSLRLKELSQSKLRQSCLGLGLWPRPVKPLSHTLYN